MTTGLSVVTGMLQRLPANVRRTLYSVISVAGLALVVAQMLGWQDLGPISVDQALQAYALVSPAVGVVAVANVSPSTQGVEDFDPHLGDFEDDFDASSFDPVVPDEAPQI
jgi:hypothetical protein